MEGNLEIKFIRKKSITIQTTHVGYWMWGQKHLKTYSNHIWKHAQKQVWVATSTLNDMCLIHVSAKPTQKSNKNQSPLLQVWIYEIVQNVNFKWKFS